MKISITILPRITTTLLLLVGSTFSLIAQEQVQRADKFYSVSGFGFAFPFGATASYLGPKFSTAVGGTLALGNSRFFLYPKASLHAYVYNELNPDPGYKTVIRDSRATTYLANLTIGYRMVAGRYGMYGFIGPGGGLILTPRVSLDMANKVATLNNKVNGMTNLETGVGTDYSLGFTLLFIEASYMRGFNKIQNRVFQSIPVTFGMKTNLSKVFYKLIK